jgi:hypothetical protein
VPDPEADGAALRTLVAAQAANRTNLTRQATAMATQAARTFHHWYETDAITEWATKLAGRIEALQRNQAQTTDAYLADADIRSSTPILSGVELRLPDFEDPVEAAAQRIAAVADLDIQLADRAQSHRFLTDHANQLNITGQRRVIHPELSKGGTCGLCIAAAQRVYHPGELRAVHGHCECTTLPIVDGRDPGAGLNGLDLKTLYGNAGNSTSAAALKRTRYKVDEHGELGPVLTDGRPFRSASDARRDTRQSTGGQPVPRSKASLERVLAVEQRAQEKAHALAKSDPKTWDRYAASLDARIADLQAQIAA